MKSKVSFTLCENKYSYMVNCGIFKAVFISKYLFFFPPLNPILKVSSSTRLGLEIEICLFNKENTSPKLIVMKVTSFHFLSCNMSFRNALYCL